MEIFRVDNMITQNREHRSTEQIEFKIAANSNERTRAFRLVYEAYVRAGLEEPDSNGLRATPYHLLNTTDVFVAKLDEEVISTLTLVRDGEFGLPLELVFPDQVNDRRSSGKRIAEATCLADRRREMDASIPVFCDICRLMVQTARAREVDELLIAVHPRHVRFYERFLAFEVISGLESYPAVRNHPAIALSLDFDRIDQEQPFAYCRFFGDSIHPEALVPRPISQPEIDMLRPIIDPGFGAGPIGPSDVEQESWPGKEHRRENNNRDELKNPLSELTWRKSASDAS